MKMFHFIKAFNSMYLSDTLWLDYIFDIQMYTNDHGLFTEYNFALDPDDLIILICFKLLTQFSGAIYWCLWSFRWTGRAWLFCYSESITLELYFRLQLLLNNKFEIKIGSNQNMVPLKTLILYINLYCLEILLTWNYLADSSVVLFTYVGYLPQISAPARIECLTS